MQSRIFDKNIGEVQEKKSQLRQNVNKPSQMGSMLSYNDGARSQNIAVKPNVTRVNNSDLQQKKVLTDYARVYNARRNQSAITF